LYTGTEQPDAALGHAPTYCSWLKECRRIGSHFEKLAVNFLALVKVSIIQRIPRILFPDRAWALLVFGINPGNSPSLFHCPMHPRRLCLHPCAFVLEEPDPPPQYISFLVRPSRH